MQFLNLITFICFRLQNYTNISIIPQIRNHPQKMK